ncbi:solute carrier family 53 member 1 isoform X1 [Drosophila tropicalis]|uniref:solute carrier family 53 member 1 isoform X1 n=1 Tax=Drosophila tropicalis TaxID=46794 RepID=UPI0035ABEFBF
MKFGKTFETLLTAEWRQQYMNYAELKAMIRRARELAPNPSNASNQQIANYYRDCEDEFFKVCDEELERVNYFFEEKLAEARRKYATLMIQMTAHHQPRDHNSATSIHKSIHDARHSRKDLKRLRLASSEFYLSLIILQNYQSLNLTGFRKICKKYDKHLNSTMGKRWFQTYALNADFTEDYELRRLIVGMEDLYTQHLANGDRSKAMQQLRVPPLGHKTPSTIIFCAGLFLGLFIVSSIICVISYFSLCDQPELLSSFVRIYRGPLSWIVYCFFISINVYIWQRCGINHVLIFEMNPRNHIQPASYLAIASSMGYICTLSMLLYLHHKEFGIDDPQPIPLTFIIVTTALFFNPIHIWNYPARMWFLSILGRVLLAPFFYVRFADFWLADQLISLVYCLVDHYQLGRFYVRYYSKREDAFDFEPDYVVAVILCLPAWFRMAQSLRRYWEGTSKSPMYLLNTLKYFSIIVVVVFSTIQRETNAGYENFFENPWFWGYIASATLSNIYQAIWDLLRDFGLFKVWQGENIFLRETLVYPKWFYYFAIWANTLLRFVWVLEFYMAYQEILTPYNCKTISGFCEITRRFIWNILRLEYEHLYNCGRFRATRDIHMTALNARQEEMLERLMDKSDNDVHKNRRRKQFNSDTQPPKIDKIYF